LDTTGWPLAVRAALQPTDLLAGLPTGHAAMLRAVTAPERPISFEVEAG
jgi:hypothetical protein